MYVREEGQELNLMSLTQVNKAVTVSKSRLHDIADMSRNCACLIEWSPVGDHPSHPSSTQPLQSACSLIFVHVQHWPTIVKMKMSSCNHQNIQCIPPPTTRPNDRDLFAPAPTGDPHSRDHRRERRYRPTSTQRFPPKATRRPCSHG